MKARHATGPGAAEESTLPPADGSSGGMDRHHPTPVRHGEGSPLMRWGRRVAVLVVCVLLSLVVGHERVEKHRSVSPVDEFQYLDYLYRGAHFHLLHNGQLIEEPTLRTVSCRGIEGIAYTPPPCDLPVHNPQEYPNYSFNTGDIHPPTYFLTDGPIARALHALGVGDEFIDAGRIVSMLWWGLGLAICWGAFRRLRLKVPVCLAMTGLLLTSPSIIDQSTIISPDSTLLFCGGAALWLLALRGEHRIGPWRLALGGLGLTLLHERNSLVLLALSIGILCLPTTTGWSLARVRPGLALPVSRVQARDAATPLIGGLIGVVGWAAVRSLTAFNEGHPDPLVAIQRVASFAPATLATGLRSFLPLLGGAPDSGSNNTAQQGFYGAFNVLLLGIALGVAVAGARGNTTVAAARGGSVLLFIGSPLLIAYSYVSAHAYFAIPLRYDIYLLPFVLAGAGGALEKPWARRSFVSLAAIAVALTLRSLYTLAVV